MDDNRMEKYSRVYATVDLDAIRFNMDSMKANINENTQMMGVIKTDGYGHGAVPVARELEPLSYMFGFAVATVEEAMILRNSGIKKPILILGYTFPYSYETIIANGLRPAVFREDMAEQLSDCVSRMRTDGEKTMSVENVKVHIKVDTGMSRIGICPDEGGIAFIKRLLNMKGIEVEGIFTHFAKADEKDKSAAEKQLSVFKEFVKRAEEETGYHIPICHCSNSAGIVELRAANMDVVRAGITMYGLWPSEEVSREIIKLRPAMGIKSRIVYIKEVEPGTAVSYGGTFVAERKTRVATVPVGYGDGYPRGLSNRGYVLLHDRKAPIIGRVCMDQFMIDITDIPDVSEGEEVTLLGRDKDKSITMEEIGRLSGRFNYELACCIGKRVPRIYLKSGKVIGAKDYFRDFE